MERTWTTVVLVGSWGLRGDVDVVTSDEVVSRDADEEDGEREATQASMRACRFVPEPEIRTASLKPEEEEGGVFVGSAEDMLRKS